MVKTRRFLATSIIMVLLASSSACMVPAKQKGQEQTPSVPAGSGETAVFPVKITDFMGREVEINNIPQRIVSLSPSTTEILFALGLGSRVVGVTNYDDYPPEVKELPKVGNFKGANIEAVIRQKADLVFASNLSGLEEMQTLERMGLKVVMLQAKNISQIKESVRTIALITGTREEGQKMVSTMEKKIDEISQKVKDLPKVKVFYLVDSNGNWTAGRDTFIHELVTLAGGENIAGELTGWMKYSLEKVVEKNPAVIITAPHAGEVKDIAKMPGFKETSAAKTGKIYVISSDNIVTRPSYRIVLGLEEMARFIHPEAFEAK
ncbi:MAG: ABC transporter substrate-binding protein [Peptococcaceae bacterium]|nr:ABC transporter substrate-binding protein [Peptococcaceae bacterium]MDH7526233.1 ABC transporter substrate-binding protein [Peptococcaceae bacterium]